MSIEGMNVVVTGGAGFIGSQLVRRLCVANKVTVIDSLHSGSTENLRGTTARFERTDAKDIAKLELKPDLVCHLGMYSASAYYSNSALMVEVQDGASQVFQFAAKHKAKVVTTSTSSVYYGQPTPQNESMVLNAGSLYAEGRIAMERLAELFARDKNLDVTVLRPFSVYGKGGEVKGKFANIANRLVLGAMRADSPVLYGDGTATRDFIDVEDVVEAFIRAADAKGFGIFNVGTGKSYSLNTLKEMVQEVTGLEINAPYAPAPPTFPAHTLADTTRAEDLLGFEAKKPLRTGIAELVEYYRLKPRVSHLATLRVQE